MGVMSNVSGRVEQWRKERRERQEDEARERKLQSDIEASAYKYRKKIGLREAARERGIARAKADYEAARKPKVPLSQKAVEVAKGLFYSSATTTQRRERVRRAGYYAEARPARSMREPGIESSLFAGGGTRARVQSRAPRKVVVKGRVYYATGRRRMVQKQPSSLFVGGGGSDKSAFI